MEIRGGFADSPRELVIRVSFPLGFGLPALNGPPSTLLAAGVFFRLSRSRKGE